MATHLPNVIIAVYYKWGSLIRNICHMMEGNNFMTMHEFSPKVILHCPSTLMLRNNLALQYIWLGLPFPASSEKIVVVLLPILPWCPACLMQKFIFISCHQLVVQKEKQIARSRKMEITVTLLPFWIQAQAFHSPQSVTWKHHAFLSQHAIIFVSMILAEFLHLITF